MGSEGTFHSLGSGWANASNTPWRMYKHFVHEGGIASPGIVHWPDGLDATPGSIHHHPAHLIDLLPTALSAAGGSPSASALSSYPGVDLIHQLNENTGADRTLCFEHQGNRAIRSGPWKLVAFDDAEWELYDVRQDRTELADLASRHPETVAALEEQWNDWAAENQVTPLPNDLRVPYLKPD